MSTWWNQPNTRERDCPLPSMCNQLIFCVFWGFQQSRNARSAMDNREARNVVDEVQRPLLTRLIAFAVEHGGGRKNGPPTRVRMASPSAC